MLSAIEIGHVLCEPRGYLFLLLCCRRRGFEHLLLSLCRFRRHRSTSGSTKASRAIMHNFMAEQVAVNAIVTPTRLALVSRALASATLLFLPDIASQDLRAIGPNVLFRVLAAGL